MSASAAPERALSPKRQRFCEEYVIDLCGRRAGLRAGYSPKTVDAIATELLQQPAVKSEIARLLHERAERTRITADRVLEELAVIAFSDIGDYGARGDGRMYLTPGARSDARRAVSSVKRKRVTTRTLQNGLVVIETVSIVDFRLWDKNAALRALMPHLGLATERTESRDLTLEELIAAAEEDEHGVAK